MAVQPVVRNPKDGVHMTGLKFEQILLMPKKNANSVVNSAEFDKTGPLGAV